MSNAPSAIASAYASYGSGGSGYYYTSGYGLTMLTQNDLYVNISTTSKTYSALPPDMPTYVTVWIAMMKTLGLANTGTLQVTAMLVVQWYDPRLTWNSTYYSCNILQMPTANMWVPDIILLNSIDPTKSVTPGAANVATIYNNGLVTLYIPSLFSAYCTLNLLNFPFDSQTCMLTFVSFSTNTTDPGVNFVAGPNTSPFRFYSTTGEFGLDSYNVSVNENLCLFYTCFSNFGLTLNYSRRSSYYVMTVIVPTILLTILLALALVIPSDSVIKITVACTLMLSLYTLQQTVARLLPATESAPLLSTGTISSLILAAFCVMMTILSVIMRIVQPALNFAFVNWLKRFCIADNQSVSKIVPVSSEASAGMEIDGEPKFDEKLTCDMPLNKLVSKLSEMDTSNTVETLLYHIAKSTNQSFALKTSEHRQAKEAELRRAREIEQNRGWRVIDTSVNVFLFIIYITAAVVCFVMFETKS